MNVTQVLLDEHALILRALETLEAAAARLERGDRLGEGWWQQLAAWFGTFADRVHHAKEEQILFPAMVRAGVPGGGGGPIGVMLAEHEEGRRLLAALADPDPRRRAETARRYAALLRAHIDKENSVLFPMAEAVLDEAARAALARDLAAGSAPEREPTLPYATAVLEGLTAALSEGPARARA
jgi:hemerythrin-like domain-containing protein